MVTVPVTLPETLPRSVLKKVRFSSMKKKVMSIILSAAMASTIFAGAAVNVSADGGRVYLLNFKPETD